MYHPAVVPTSWPTEKTHKFDWNHFIFRSCVYNEQWSEIKILTIEQKLKHVINDKAILLAFDKYPNWGYLDNKRADNFVRKHERIMLEAGKIPIQESISVREDGLLEVVVNALTEVDIEKRVFELLELFEFDGLQTFSEPLYRSIVQTEEEE